MGDLALLDAQRAVEQAPAQKTLGLGKLRVDLADDLADPSQDLRVLDDLGGGSSSKLGLKQLEVRHQERCQVRLAVSDDHRLEQQAVVRQALFDRLGRDPIAVRGH